MMVAHRKSGRSRIKVRFDGHRRGHARRMIGAVGNLRHTLPPEAEAISARGTRAECPRRAVGRVAHVAPSATQKPPQGRGQGRLG